MQDYETINADLHNESVCPSCKEKGTLSYSTMLEEGVHYPVKVCSACQWWG